MAYSKQIITDLCNQIPDVLISFFNTEHDRFFYEFENFGDIVSVTLSEFINNKNTKSELTALRHDIVRARRQKKMRWRSICQKSAAEYNLSSSRNPFFSVYQSITLLPGESLLKLYGTTDINVIVDRIWNEIDDWVSDSEKILIEFPLITSKTRNQILNNFKIDLIVALIGIIIDSYDGNLDSYFSRKPEFLLASPLFSPTKYNVPVTPGLDSYIADLVSYDKDDLVFQMLVAYDPNNPEDSLVQTVFDQKDNQLLLYLFNNINLDFYQSRQLIVEVGALAKALNPRPNKRMYEDVKLRIHNMQRVTFRYCKKSNPNEPIFSYNFFSTVKTIVQDDREYLVITFGDTLYDSVTKHKMVSVTTNNYNALDLNLSRLLYHHLQKERINLSAASSTGADGLLFKKFDYSYFQRIILFKSRKRKDNINMIKEALSEFVDKRVALSKYTYDEQEGFFYLYFFPLSNDEKADLVNKTDPSPFPILDLLDTLSVS